MDLKKYKGEGWFTVTIAGITLQFAHEWTKHYRNAWSKDGFTFVGAHFKEDIVDGVRVIQLWLVGLGIRIAWIHDPDAATKSRARQLEWEAEEQLKWDVFLQEELKRAAVNGLEGRRDGGAL